jgi:hypothetical protein
MMEYLSQFNLTLGATLALVALVAAWFFRTADAWIGWKLALPVTLVALACWTPHTVKAMMGLPVGASMAALPDEAQLVAFFPHDQEGLVDLWLVSGPVPRAYEIALDKATKKLLQAATVDLAQGKPVFVRKREDGGHASDRPGGGAPYTDVKDNFEPRYEVDDSALANLPAKE